LGVTGVIAVIAVFVIVGLTQVGRLSVQQCLLAIRTWLRWVKP
jgi:hypothetical protein